MSYAFNNFVHTKGIDDLAEVLICTEPDKNEAVRVYFKMPMNKLAFSKAIARATAKGCKYGKISSWSHEELMQKSGIIYFTLTDEATQQEELNRQKMEAFLNNNF